MSTVAYRELRNDTAGVLRRVQAGEEVTITVNGRAVAVIAAVGPRRRRRVRVNDLWIAAIAAAKQLPVVTQDADFDVLEGVAGLAIIHV